jgi:hypothetical protein
MPLMLLGKGGNDIFDGFMDLGDAFDEEDEDEDALI